MAQSVGKVPLIRDLEAPEALLTLGEVRRYLGSLLIDAAAVGPSAIRLHQLNWHVDVGQRDAPLLLLIAAQIPWCSSGLNYIQLGVQDF